MQKSEGTPVPSYSIPTGRLIARSGPRFTGRDFEIIQFLCQMRYSGIEEIHEKFFLKTQSGTESRSLRWARERVQLLCRYRLIQTDSLPGSIRKYFLATRRGAILAEQFLYLDRPLIPTRRIDIRTFEHELAVLRIRLELESQGSVNRWISEPELRSSMSEFGTFRSEFCPDAIYKTPTGSSIAVEVEISPKSRRRYQDKIRSYVDLIRESKNDPNGIRKVQFYCFKKFATQVFREETRVYSSWFEVIERLKT